ncbi:hypothetical protein HK096_000705, partial [Nowakowskiella sp. JEL0078]
HQAERLGLLTLMVLGEVVVGILWDSPNAEITLAYVVTFFGLLISIGFQWIYFNVEGGHQFEHAIRRSALSGISWQLFHVPLHISLVAAGAGISKLVEAEEKNHPMSSELRVMFFVGCGVSMISLCVLGITHKHAPDEHVRLSKNFRFTLRFIIGTFLILFGCLSQIENPALAVGIVCLSVIILVSFEEFARLEKKEKAEFYLSEAGECVLDIKEEEIIIVHPLAGEQIRRKAIERNRKTKIRAIKQAQKQKRYQKLFLSMDVNKEVEELVAAIKRLGSDNNGKFGVTFGTLFDDEKCQ